MAVDKNRYKYIKRKRVFIDCVHKQDDTCNKPDSIYYDAIIHPGRKFACFHCTKYTQAKVNREYSSMEEPG